MEEPGQKLSVLLVADLLFLVPHLDELEHLFHNFLDLVTLSTKDNFTSKHAPEHLKHQVGILVALVGEDFFKVFETV